VTLKTIRTAKTGRPHRVDDAAFATRGGRRFNISHNSNGFQPPHFILAGRRKCRSRRRSQGKKRGQDGCLRVKRKIHAENHV